MEELTNLCTCGGKHEHDELTFFYYDPSGSTRELLDGVGDVAGRASYDAYDNALAQAGASTPFGYDGQYTDAETGLQYV